MNVGITKSAAKQLKKLGKAIQIILTDKIRKLEHSQSKEQKLAGFKNAFRVRAGNYRIVYQKKPDIIVVILVGHRKEIYRLLTELLG